MWVYIWTEEQEWQPWENTLLYLPLESDVVDKSWRTWRTFTTSWITYTTVGGVPSMHNWTSWGIRLTAPYPLQPTVTNPLTLSVLVYITSWQISSRRDVVDFAATWWKNRLFLVFMENSTNLKFSNEDLSINATFTSYINNRMNIVVTGSVWNPFKMYINWELVVTWDTNVVRPRWNWTQTWTDIVQAIWCRRTNAEYKEGINWNMRELIMEEAEWTADDVSKYYQRIKSKLWI